MRKFKEEVRMKICQFISAFQVDIAHDIYHLDRVCETAVYLNNKENGGDMQEIIILASYMHDFHRLYSEQFGNEKLKPVQEADHLVDQFFTIHRQYDHFRDQVLKTIHFTDRYSFEGKKSNSGKNISGEIIFDADNLDAIGAIGVARAFAFGQWIQEPIFRPEECLQNSGYELTRKSTSVVHHFYEKILHLADELYTDTAIKMAKKRMKFTKKYISELLKEFNINES